jgi:hypothetical protein
MNVLENSLGAYISSGDLRCRQFNRVVHQKHIAVLESITISGWINK